MKKKFTFLMTAMALIFAMMGSREAWGQTTTYTMQSYSNNIITSDNDATWATSSACGGSELPYALNSERGAGFQANNTVTSSFSVTNASKITVIASSNGNKTTTLAVKVGNTTFGNTVSLPKQDYQTLEFTAPNNTPVSGTIVFTITRSSKTLWIGQVIVETATPSTDPTVTVNPTSLDLGTVNINEEASATFTVSQANLTNGITLSATNGNLNVTSIDAGADDMEITYTITPSAVGTISDIITLSCEDLDEDITININGTAVKLVTYQKVTSTDDLVAGATYLIVGTALNNNTNIALGWQDNDNRKSAAVTISNNSIATVPATSNAETDKPFEITLGGTANAWTLFDAANNGYLYAAASNKNYLKVQQENDANGQWAIEISNEGIASFTAQGNNSRNKLKQNGNIFSCYSSGQTPVSLYKRASSVATPTFTPAAGTYAEAQNVTISCATEGAAIYYTLDGTEPSNSSTLYTETINISETTTIKAIAYLNGEASDIATAEYEIVVLYNITIYPSAFSEVTTSPADEAAAGTEVTITISNIEEHYHISEITVYDSYDNLVPVDDNGKFTMPESDVSISVTFLPDPQFFIHYYSNGSSDSFEIVYAGPIGELREPSELNFPEGFTFAGWSTSMASTTAITESYNVTANTDLFAIFARVEGGSGETTATLTNSEIIGSSSLTSSYGNFTITNTYGTWSGNGCKQGNYSGDGMYFLQLRNNEETVSYLKLPTFPGNITSVVCEQVCNTSKTQYTGNIYFRTAADNNADAIVTATSNEALDNVTLNIPSGYTTGYIMVSNPCRIFSFTVTYQSGVTRYYTRVFQGHIVMDDITIEGPSIISAGSTLNMDDYTLTNTDPANLIIEDGAQLIHHNAGVQATMRKEVTAYSTTEGVNNGWYFVASPMAALTSHNLNNGTFDLYKFEQSADKEWKNYESTAFSITNKEGYLYANAANTTIEFVGTLNATDGSKTLAYADVRFAGFNLIGNPFACNANIGTQDFYICNGENIILAENSTIAPCTGIMVKANNTEESVTFVKGEETTRATNAMDITIAKATRNANTIDRARINFSGDSQLSKFFFNENSCLYIPQKGEDFAVVAAQNEGELPVNFKAEKNGTYTITVNTENVEANYLHLIDNLTGMDTDLLSTPSYTFDAKTSDYASRFKLVFSMNNVENNQVEANSFAFISNGEIVISNEGRATLQVIDVMGRIVSSEEINGECRISTNGLTAGLYILNLNGNVQKIVVR